MRKCLVRRLLSLRRSGLALAHALALACAAPLAAQDDGGTEPLRGSGEILELKDEALITRLWETLHGDSLPLPPGEYQLLIPLDAQLSLPGGERDAGVFLLRNGTMEGRLDRMAWEWAAAQSREQKVVRWKDDWEEPESEYIPTLWQSFRVDRERIERWTGWPSGFRFGMGSAMSMVPSANPQFERELEFEWNQKLYRHFLLGGALRRIEYGGGLLRTARSGQVTGFGADTVQPAFWSEPFWWWSLSAGLPGARYTLYLADRPLPDYFWLETRASALIKENKAGKVVKQWQDSSLAPGGNVGHSLDLRLGYARYRLHWDGEAYASAVQAWELDELPVFFGHWGVGLITAAEVAATRAWLDIADFGFSLARPSQYPSRFRFAFLRLDVAYRNLRSFHLGISLNVRLENPIMNLPGAAP